jgi:hypothetical protein
MAITRARTFRRRTRSNPMELLVVNPGRPGRRVQGAAHKRKMRSRAATRLANGRFKAKKKKSPVRKSAKRRTTSTKTAAAPKRKKTMARRRRKSAAAHKVRKVRKVRRVARKAPRKRKARKARRTRKVRANPSRPRRIRRRRLRRNGVRDQKAAIALGAASAPRKARRHRRSKRVLGAARKRRTVRRRLLSQVRQYRKRAKSAPKRSVRRSTAMVQYRRAQGLRRVALSKRGVKGMKHSSLAKAMHLKTNPGLQGLIVAAKVLAPQVGVGAIGLFGLAMLGAKVAAAINKPGTDGKTMLPASVVPYAPALATAGLSVAAYLVADKVAPKYKGAIAIGGLLAAVIQAVAASGKSAEGLKADSIQSKIKSALGLGEYTSVGGGMFGEYTSVGVGEYTSVGSGGDNSTEWANDSLRGLDDSTQWASGEGGVLSGGMFK